MSIFKTRKLDKNKEKKYKRKRRVESLDLMSANIVTKAVHDERGQEGEKKQKVKR